MIGILMIRDEQDVLEEALQNHTKFCDVIFVLDGTDGENKRISEEICRSFSKVHGYWTDDDTGYAKPLRDGARQFLLERARGKFGANNWYVILHGDEIWGQDPRYFVDSKPSEMDGISVDLYHFFPHDSERNSWDFKEGISSIETISKWYMSPPITEHRLFYDSGEKNFTISRHSRVIPDEVQLYHSGIVVKQYNYRSPQQAHKRAMQRRDSRWQYNHYQHLLDGPDSFFIETLVSDNYQWAAMVPIGDGEAKNVVNHPLPSLRRSK